jgi:hypothetical protein
MFPFDDPLLGGSENDRKRERLWYNQRKGRAAEERVEMELLIEGYEVERTHYGSDFKATKRDFLTGEVVEEKYVEAKSGDARLSDRQKKEKKRRKNYEVRRRNLFF